MITRLWNPFSEAMDLTSLRLNLDGFSDELADEIGLYDVLTIRGMTGDAATPMPDHSKREEEVAAPATPVTIHTGAVTSPVSVSSAASSTTFDPSMQFT